MELAMDQNAFIPDQMATGGRYISKFICDYPEDVNPLTYRYRFDYIVQEQLPGQFNFILLSPLNKFWLN
tara:strand:- start:29 stop:235 length:207 start_codon:yes stop_codon:yes gene_type:complete